MRRNRRVRQARARRVRVRLKKEANRPRLSVFRSNKFTYVQLIDDTLGKTLVAVSEKDLREGTDTASTKTSSVRQGKATKKVRASAAKLTKSQRAAELGKLLAQRALKKGIRAIAFDRGPYRYHGRLKAFAEAARQEGLSF